MLKIYQLDPTVVLQTNEKVLKIFASPEKCANELELLSRSNDPILSQMSAGETLQIINAEAPMDTVLVLPPAKGRPLSISSENQAQDVEMAAKLLAARHKEMNKEPLQCEGRLLGDFVIDHLFWNDDSKVMTIIDPGQNYMVEGDLTEDIARFLFSVTSLYRWKILQSMKLITRFVKAYLNHFGLPKHHLNRGLTLRYVRSTQKYNMQKTGARRVVALALLHYQYLLIKFVIRKVK